MDQTPATHSENTEGVSHLDEDTILDLWVADLPADERRSANAHLAACPECEDLFRRRGAEIEGLRTAPIYQALFHEKTLPRPFREEARARARQASIPPVDDLSTGTPLDLQTRGQRGMGIAERFCRDLLGSLRRPRVILTTATGLVATVVVTLLIMNPGKPVVLPYEAEWLPPPSEFTEPRGDTAPSNAGFLRAFEAYNHRDLEEAIRMLSSARPPRSLEWLRRVYLGNALVQRGDFDQAAAILRAVRSEDLPDIWNGRAEWTLLVALHRAGRRADAESLLKSMAAEPGEFGDRARRILGKPAPPKSR